MTRDSKQYFEAEIDHLNFQVKKESSELIARVEYYESEIREINGMINFFNQYLSTQESKKFELLVIYKRLYARMMDLEQRRQGMGNNI